MESLTRTPLRPFSSVRKVVSNSYLDSLVPDVPCALENLPETGMFILVLAQTEVPAPVHVFALRSAESVVLDAPEAIDERMLEDRLRLPSAKDQLIHRNNDAHCAYGHSDSGRDAGYVSDHG